MSFHFHYCPGKTGRGVNDHHRHDFEMSSLDSMQHSEQHHVSIVWLAANGTHAHNTLQVHQRGGWAVFRVLVHLTTKERPCHDYSDAQAPLVALLYVIVCPIICFEGEC